MGNTKHCYIDIDIDPLINRIISLNPQGMNLHQLLQFIGLNPTGVIFICLGITFMMPRLSFKEHTIHPTGCVDQCCSDCMLGAHPPPTGCSLYSLILPLTGVFISNLEHITIQGLLISNIIYNTQHGVVIIGIMVSYFSPQGCLLAPQGSLFIFPHRGVYLPHRGLYLSHREILEQGSQTHPH